MSYDRDELGYDLGYESDRIESNNFSHGKVLSPEEIIPYSCDGAVKVIGGPKADGSYDVDTTGDGVPDATYTKEQVDNLNNKSTDQPAAPAPDKKDSGGGTPPPAVDLKKVTKVDEDKDGNLLVSQEGTTIVTTIPKGHADYSKVKLKKDELDEKAKAAGKPEDNSNEAAKNKVKHAAVVKAKKPEEPAYVSPYFIDQQPPEAASAAADVRAFFKNKEDASAYMRLHPYPKKGSVGFEKAKANWEKQFKADKTKGLETVKKEMRQAQAQKELEWMRSQGVPMEVAFGYLKAKKVLAEGHALPDQKDWDNKKKPLPEQTVRVNDDYDVYQSQKDFEAFQAEFSKDLKKADTATKKEWVMKQTKGLGVYHTYKEQMKDFSKEQVDAIFTTAKWMKDGHVFIADPNEVAGYLFEASEGKMFTEEVIGYPRVNSDAKVKPLPKVDGKEIHPGKLPTGVSEGDIEKADPYTKAVYHVAQTNPAPVTTTSAKVSKGKFAAPVKDPWLQPPPRPEGFTDKQWKIYVTTWDSSKAKSRASAGLKMPAVGAAGGEAGTVDQDWAVPGTKQGDRGDVEAQKAMALETQRMKRIGFTDEEIGRYQEVHGGRSANEISESFPPPKGYDSWDMVPSDEKNKELASKEFTQGVLTKGKTNLEKYETALEGERTAMVQEYGFTPTEAEEYQRQHPNRKVGDIGKRFPKDANSDVRTEVTKNVRKEMEDTMIEEGAVAIRKIDPSITEKNARLMSRQAYYNNMGITPGDKKPEQLDKMIAARKGVQDDLHLATEYRDHPTEHEGKTPPLEDLKRQTAVFLQNDYYAKARKEVEGDKELKKYYGEEKDKKGQKNLQLYAVGQGVDLNDPSQVADLTESVTAKKLQAHQGLAEKDPAYRKELEGKYAAKSQGANGADALGYTDTPDFDLLPKKDRGAKEFEWQEKNIHQKKEDIKRLQDKKWRDAEKKADQDFQKEMEGERNAHQDAMAAVQNEWQKQNELLRQAWGFMFSIPGKFMDIGAEGLKMAMGDSFGTFRDLRQIGQQQMLMPLNKFYSGQQRV